MPQPIGILLAQLGTPDAPTAAALRPYLRQFLSDRRVIEVPRPIWWCILNLFILPFRPRASARKYANIWSKQHGSPLLHYTNRQRDLLAAELGEEFAVAVGMRYGNPSIPSALESLLQRGIDRIVVMPLYPQYAASSTASVIDAAFATALARRHVPSLHVVPPYWNEDGYLDAISLRVEETLGALDPGAPSDHLLITFHGLPVEMVEKGDPYRRHCEATAARLAERLGMKSDDWSLTFQSRFGRTEWLQPYTDDRLAELAADGKRHVTVVAPGFAADCLETLDELGRESAEAFQKAGGKKLTLVPCLNDHPAWIQALARIVEREAGGWLK